MFSHGDADGLFVRRPPTDSFRSISLRAQLDYEQHTYEAPDPWDINSDSGSGPDSSPDSDPFWLLHRLQQRRRPADRLDAGALHLALSPGVAHTAAVLAQLPLFPLPSSSIMASSDASSTSDMPPPRAWPPPPRLPLHVHPAASSTPTDRALRRASVCPATTAAALTDSTRRSRRISAPLPLKLVQSTEPGTRRRLRPFRLSLQPGDFDELARLRADGLAARESRQMRRQHQHQQPPTATVSPGTTATARGPRPDSPRQIAEGDQEMRALLLGPLARAENELLDQAEERSRFHHVASADHDRIADPVIAKAAAALLDRKTETSLALESVQLGGGTAHKPSPSPATPRKPPYRPQQHARQPSLSGQSPVRQPPNAFVHRQALPPSPPLSPQRRAHSKETKETKETKEAKEATGRGQDHHGKPAFWRDSIQSVMSWGSTM